MILGLSLCSLLVAASLIVQFLLISFVIHPIAQKETDITQEGNRELFPPKHDLLGFIDSTGRIIIKPQYNGAMDFSDGLAAVRVGDEKSGKWGCIDKSGHEVIPPAYTHPPIFAQGLAPVPSGDKWGYIDKSGRFVIRPQFAEAHGFSEDRAPVRLSKNGRIGFIDLRGRVAINPEFDDFRTGFSGGLAVVKAPRLFRASKWGVIDKTGEFVASPMYDDALPYTEGLSRVQMDGRWGFIDTSGNQVIRPQYAKASPFNAGRSAVQLQNSSDPDHASLQANTWTCIDKKGKELFTFQYDGPIEFSDGLCPVFIGDKFGYIDAQGKVAIPPSFHGTASSFSEGKTTVQMDGKVGFIDRSGHIVIRPTFDYAAPFHEGFAIIGMNQVYSE